MIASSPTVTRYPLGKPRPGKRRHSLHRCERVTGHRKTGAPGFTSRRTQIRASLPHPLVDTRDHAAGVRTRYDDVPCRAIATDARGDRDPKRVRIGAVERHSRNPGRAWTGCARGRDIDRQQARASCLGERSLNLPCNTGRRALHRDLTHTEEGCLARDDVGAYRSCEQGERERE